MSLVILFATSLWADSDIRDNTNTATSIVLGEVTESQSYYGSDGEIYTDVTLNVNATLKETGRKGARVRTFTVKGGVVGDNRVIFSDVPSFEIEEAVVLFFEGEVAREKYSIRHGWVVELGERATKVLDRIEETLRDQNEPIVESERQHARAFLAEMNVGAPPADAGCFVLIGPKWTSSLATFKYGTTIPDAWKSALNSSVSAWNSAGTNFSFRQDAASLNEFLIGPVSSSSVLASTRISYTSTGMRQFSITFSNTVNWSTSGEPGKFDIENVTTHELGHALGLNHPSGSACTEQTMWASAGSGETKKRSLENGDKAGAASLYVATSTPAPTPAPPPPPPPPPAPTPAPAPAPAPATTPAPLFNTAYIFPSVPRAGQTFNLWAAGSGFVTTTVQIVITGPACPAGCVLTPSYRTASMLSTSTSLAAAGSYTIAIRNGATGALSAPKPLRIQ